MTIQRPQVLDGHQMVYMPTQPPEGWQAIPQGGPHARIPFTRVGDHWQARHTALTWHALLASARSGGVQVLRPSPVGA